MTTGVTVVVVRRPHPGGRPATAQVPVPAGAQVIDAHGRMLLPGLWDMHQHLSDDDGLLDLAAGVTTVRDLGNDIGLPARRSSRSGTPARRSARGCVLAGVIDGPGPYAGPTKVLVDTEEKARAAVDRYAELGYVQIKIYSSLDPELVPVIVAERPRPGCGSPATSRTG